MKRTWKNFRLDKKKVYQFIGQAVVYSSLYIGSIAFFCWAFLQGLTYQEGKMELIKEILFWWLLLYDIAVVTIKPIRKNLIDFLRKMDN